MKEDTIWCYTGDPQKPEIEICDPIGYVEAEDSGYDLCGISEETIIGNGVTYKGC